MSKTILRWVRNKIVGLFAQPVPLEYAIRQLYKGEEIEIDKRDLPIIVEAVQFSAQCPAIRVKTEAGRCELELCK